MTEKSIFWTTGSTGDGTSEYTMAELIRWLRQTYISDSTDEGICKGYGGDLQVTGTSSPVSIATGGALIYGFPYWQTAASTLTIPTPSGDTRIDRVVLSADWTAQTVRLERVAGAEGGAAPALTQTDGVEWQVSLAQCSITTGGVITVTDEREYLHPGWEIEAGQFNANVAGDGLSLSAGALAVNVDDSTIETNADALRAKAGGLDNSHMANRGRIVFVPATEGYNTTDTAYITRNDIKGLEMPDAKESECYGHFRVPSDWVSGGAIQGYMIGGGAGDAAMRLYAQYGADGEAYNTHTAQSSALRYITCVANQIDATDDVGSVSLSSLAAGDVINFRVYRDGTDLGDTLAASVFFIGFTFSYAADM